MTVHFECQGFWDPACDVRAGDRLEYDPEAGALCPACGCAIAVLIESVFIQVIDDV